VVLVSTAAVVERGVPDKVGLALSTTLVVPVLVVTPVPPFATARVPAKVTAPVVAVLGVRPVVPALNDDTKDPLTVRLLVEYHWVVLDALNCITPATGIWMLAFAARASTAAPVAGKTLIGFAPLFTMTMRLPAVAVGSVTPEGLAAAVVMTL
jgi:hypothetical protein